MDGKWQWAALTGDQLNMVMEAEKTLGNNVKYLLVYQQAQAVPGNNVTKSPDHHPIASLSESQIECLNGLEKQLGAVVIAYQ